MNRRYFILFLIFTSVCLQAQQPRGGGGGMGRGGSRQGSPQGNRGGTGGQEQFRIDYFPPIPGITLEQRADIGIILVNEQKDIAKYIQKQHEYMEKGRLSPRQSEKEKEKIRRQIDKLDVDIRKRIEKSDKKIRKILSEGQYRVFLERRNEFKFSRIGGIPGAPGAPGGERRPEGGGSRERPR
jgi:hypothetical protein